MSTARLENENWYDAWLYDFWWIMSTGGISANTRRMLYSSDLGQKTDRYVIRWRRKFSPLTRSLFNTFWAIVSPLNVTMNEYFSAFLLSLSRNDNVHLCIREEKVFLFAAYAIFCSNLGPQSKRFLFPAALCWSKSDFFCDDCRSVNGLKTAPHSFFLRAVFVSHFLCHRTTKEKNRFKFSEKINKFQVVWVLLR